MNRRNFALVLLLCLTIATVGLAVWWNNQSLPAHTLQINQHRFNITVANTPAEKTRGLAGTAQLDPHEGMLFPLNGQPASFWMKDMVIDIDIIWIKDNKIVGIDHNVLAPELGTPDSELPNYPSPVDKPQAVFEIGAGQAKKLEITVGDTVEWRE